MPYTFDPIFAVDPGNPANVAANAVVTIFAPGDTSLTPLVLTTPDGLPFENPVTTSSSGHAGAFVHESLGRVAWSGGGFTGFFTAHDSIKQEAVAARDAAQLAAENAAAELSARITAGEFQGEPGRDGSNVVPTAQAIATEISTEGTPANTALSATYALKDELPASIIVSTDVNAPLTDGQVLFVVEPDWSPSLIPGVQIWYDAQQQSAVNGASLPQITDYSGQTRHASQAVVGGQPVMNTTGINGKSAFQFLASSGRRATTGTFTTPIAPGPLTVVAVAASATPGVAAFVFNAAEGTSDLGMFKSSGTGAMNMNRGATVIAGPSDASPHVWLAEYINGQSFLHEDGAQIGTGTFAAPGNITDLTFGARRDGIRLWDGVIGELILISGLLTADEKTKLSEYVANKWGI